MIESCECGNIVVEWDTNISPLVARKCDCEYCVSSGAEFVSDPDSLVQFKILDKTKHQIIKHGHETAEFHECSECGVIFVASEIDGSTYCVLNANALGLENYVLDSQLKSYKGESVEQRLARRKRNWSQVRVGSSQ